MNTTQTNSNEEVIWEGSQSQVLNIGTFISMGIISIIILVLGLMFFPPAAGLVIVPQV
jgi:hypothetical protein